MYQKEQRLSKNRMLTQNEELANSITHGLSAFAVLVFMPFIASTMHNANLSVRDIIGVMIFLFSIFMMFLMSTLYHSMPGKLVMRKLDHIFIFVAIAGSCTPIALSFVWNIPNYGKTAAIVIITIQWLSVIGGIFFKANSKADKLNASLPIYMAMGSILLFIFPLFIKYNFFKLFWAIVAGGLFYSLGVIFFAFKHIKYTHLYWHFFVTFGAFSHIIGICYFLCLKP